MATAVGWTTSAGDFWERDQIVSTKFRSAFHVHGVTGG